MLNISEVFNELLTEAVQANRIIVAIREARVIKIYYAGDNINKPGFRTIEPYCYGTNHFGNLCIRAWQIGGVSDTPQGTMKKGGIDPLSRIPGWRMFRVDKITSWDNVAGGNNGKGKTAYKIFDTTQTYISSNRPKYNPKDKDMTSIVISVQPKTDNDLPPTDVQPTNPIPTSPIGGKKQVEPIVNKNKFVSKKPIEKPDEIIDNKDELTEENRKLIRNAILNNFNIKNIFKKDK